jgi:hypothetical protein
MISDNFYFLSVEANQLHQEDPIVVLDVRVVAQDVRVVAQDVREGHHDQGSSLNRLFFYD